jgi:hypothetical protein
VTVQNRESITFDEFGEWYNSGGFQRAQWLELLDTSKWQVARAAEQAQRARAEDESAAKEAEGGGTLAAPLVCALMSAYMCTPVCADLCC